MSLFSFSRTCFLSAGALLFFAAGAAAQLPIPRLLSLYPAGGRHGTSVEIEVGGQNLDDATGLYFSHPGLKAERLPPADDKDKRTRFRIDIAADVPVSDHDMRLIGRHGVSNPRTFAVGAVPELPEQEPNNEAAQATPVMPGHVINGRVDPAEDVDWFSFEAKSGERLVIECRAWRIDSRLDASLWLFDAAGRQLASSHDVGLRNEKRDPFLDIQIPSDGKYFLKLTDFTYAGNAEHFYRVHLSSGPYVDLVMPLAAQAQKPASLKIYGRKLPGAADSALQAGEIKLQEQSRDWSPSGDAAPAGLAFGQVVRPAASFHQGWSLRIDAPDADASNALCLMAGTEREITELEPNNAREKAQKLEAPCGVSGWLDLADLDHYLLPAKKGRKFKIEIFGERLGSPVDPELEILKPDGSVLKTVSDETRNIGQNRFDTRHRDVTFVFEAPEDGDYVLRLEHLYRQVQGGPTFFYRLAVTPDPKPDFSLVCVPEHEIHVDSSVVYRKGRERLDILVNRHNGFEGPIQIEARNLPAGLTADPITIGPKMTWGTFVLTATADAPMEHREIEIVGIAQLETGPLEHRAHGGVIVWDTVNTPAISRATRSIVVSVRDTVPFTVTAEKTEFEIEAGGELDIPIKLWRQEEMKNAVQINAQGYALPDGLKIDQVTIEPGADSATAHLKTEAKIPPGRYSIIVQGDGQVPRDGGKNNIRCVYPSNPIHLTVKPRPEKK